MSKRLIRTFASAIPNLLHTLLDREVHVVLRNGHTVFGNLKSLINNTLIIKDLREHSHEIKLSDVEEIIQDCRSSRLFPVS